MTEYMMEDGGKRMLKARREKVNGKQKEYTMSRRIIGRKNGACATRPVEKGMPAGITGLFVEMPFALGIPSVVESFHYQRLYQWLVAEIVNARKWLLVLPFVDANCRQTKAASLIDSNYSREPVEWFHAVTPFHRVW